MSAAQTFDVYLNYIYQNEFTSILVDVKLILIHIKEGKINNGAELYIFVIICNYCAVLVIIESNAKKFFLKKIILL